MVALLLVALSAACTSSFTLPTDAPAVLRTGCGWPPTTPLTFAGRATRAQLGLSDSRGRLDSADVVYAIVTRDRVSMPTNGGGPPIVARGMCYADDEGWGQSAVADDWQLR